MKLKELLQGIQIQQMTADAELEIREVCYDSRKVQKGDLFVAIRGYAVDGHQYLEKALEQGAAAVLCEEAPTQMPAVLVKNTRAALAQVAANRFGHPAEKMTMIGVTGTNGKTTTTYLLKHILESCGAKVGLIGTNQNLIGAQVLETERTTPESYELHALFAQMLEAKCTHVIMEVSSHSLVLDRVRGIPYTVGAFTNLTQDHLDFHHTMEEYRRAKAKLFSMSKQGVINLDDAAAEKMLADAACPVCTVSAEQAADLCAKEIALHADCVEFQCVTPQEQVAVRLGIPGMFSVHNALTALGCAVALGIPLSDAAKALASASGVKGRIEVVPTDTPYTVLIDYAHSPDGVENILQAVRGFAKGRVIAVFGCGGDRDKTKRPKMGAIAARLADVCVVTSDNPRTEDPAAILEDIVAGMQEHLDTTTVIENRTEAIFWALDHAQKDDIVVLMGKGHETYQEIHHVKHHLDEREEVAKYFSAKK